MLLFLAVFGLGSAASSTAAGIVQDYSDLGGKPYSVTWDSRSMRLDDKPVMLLSGSIHYPRSTPAMWPALFAEARANGLNTIESYVFWSYHKRTATDPYDYTGSGNVTLFLELAKQHNLFVIWRFGPVSNSHTMSPPIRTITDTHLITSTSVPNGLEAVFLTG